MKFRYIVITICCCIQIIGSAQTTLSGFVRENILDPNSTISVLNKTDCYIVFCTALDQDIIENPKLEYNRKTKLIILKISKTGEEIWERRFGTTKENIAREIISSSNNGWITRSEYSEGYNWNTLLMNFDSTGNVKWEMILDSLKSSHSIYKFNDNEYFVLTTKLTRIISEKNMYYLMLENILPVSKERKQTILDTVTEGSAKFIFTQNFNDHYLFNRKYVKKNDRSKINILYHDECNEFLYYLNVSKIDSNGSIIWSCPINSHCYIDEGKVIHDSVIILPGYLNNKDKYELFITAIKKNGNHLFAKFLDTLDFCSSVKLTILSDNKFIICTSIEGIIILYKLSEYGDIEWKREYSKKNFDLVSPVFIEDQNGYTILCSAGNSNAKTKGLGIYIIKSKW